MLELVGRERIGRKLIGGALAACVVLGAGSAVAEEVGKVGVDWVGNDIIVEAIKDPKVDGVTCHAEAIYTSIGKFCSIAANSRINALEHPIERLTQHKVSYRPNEYFRWLGVDAAFRARRQAKAVTIGHDVWIGHGAVIMAAKKAVAQKRAPKKHAA